jgi:hypothetical protein
MTKVGKKLIWKGEIEKLLSLMTNPRAVCQNCKGAVDCIGIEECYPAEEYRVIDITITNPSQKEIVRMVNS